MDYINTSYQTNNYAINWKQNVSRPLNVVNFGGKEKLARISPKVQQKLPADIKFPKLKIKLSGLLKRLSLYALKLSEKVIKLPQLTDVDRIIEQQKLIRSLTKNLNKANDKVDELTTGKIQNEAEIAGLNGEIDELESKLNSANSEIADLKSEMQKSKDEFEIAIAALEKGDINPKLRAKIKEEIINTELNYDFDSPYFEAEKALYPPEKYNCVYADIQTGTTNRADMQELEIPETSWSGALDFELPKGEMKVKKVKLKELKEPFEIQSNISDKYSESLVWNIDKIVRDMLQNFFDGHGQTLDGVRFIFKPTGIGKYKVRIEGKSTYNFKEAVLLGESQSHNDNKAAGNYGEGLKMVTLKLLMQNKASKVKIGAGNWEVICGLKKDDRLDSELMHYQINPVEEYDGNFIEFETSDKNLLETIRKSINRFYHSSNPHFKAPDFENDLFGIKVLPWNERGGLYIAGQRFEYEGNFDGIKGGVLFIKQKVPTDCYDTSRDRVSINDYNFREIARWLDKNTKMASEYRQIIKVLEPFIDAYRHPLNDMLDIFVDSLGDEIRYGRIGAIKFPDKYIAKNSLFVDDRILYNLHSNGYKVFPSGYVKLGMNSIGNIIKKAREHQSLKPTETEKTKIVIIKRALNLLSDLKIEHFSDKELNAKIYVFDAKSPKENSIDRYKNVLAEAIVDQSNEKSYGFWIDKTYLKNAKFAHVLETALHELSHKVGGDSTAEFSYKLTDVNQEAIMQIVRDPRIAEEFRILNDIWENL